MKTSHLLLGAATFCLMGLTSCADDDTTQRSRNDGTVRFESTIASMSSGTRASGMDWDAGDAIGAYMVTADQPLSTTSALAENKKYTTPGTNSFSPATTADAIKLPESGNVDFIAYYPYQTTVTDFEIPVDVSVQTAPKTIDLLYSNNAKGISGNDDVALGFTHMLSKISFTVVDEGGASLSGLSVTISGLNTKADFSLVDGSFSNYSAVTDITGITTVSASNATSEALILPTTGTTGMSVAFASPTFSYTHDFADNTVFESGKHYTYNVKISPDGSVTVTGSITDWTVVPGEDINLNPDDNGGGTGEDVVVYSETFGNGDYPSGNRPKIAAFTDWDETGVTYSDASGLTDIRSSNSMNAHAWFPTSGDAYLTISGIDTDGYDDIVLTFDMAANTFGVSGTTVLSDMMNVSWNGTALTLPTVTLTDADQSFHSFEISTGITATSNGILEFHADPANNTLGLRIDNIKIVAKGEGGTDPGPGPGPQPGEGYSAGTLASWDFTTYGYTGTANDYVNQSPINSTGSSDFLTTTATVTAYGGSESGKVAYGVNSNIGYIITKGLIATALDEHGWLITMPLADKIEAGKKISISFSAYGSGTGAKEWTGEFSTDNTSWTTVGNYDLASSGSVKNLEYTVAQEITASNIYFRLHPRSNVNINDNGSAFAATGTSRLGNPTIAVD